MSPSILVVDDDETIRETLVEFFQALGYRLVSRSAEIRFDVPAIGLLVILLLFVLAQVFAEGTRIRDDLKAMI